MSLPGLAAYGVDTCVFKVGTEVSGPELQTELNSWLQPFSKFLNLDPDEYRRELLAPLVLKLKKRSDRVVYDSLYMVGLEPAENPGNGISAHIQGLLGNRDPVMKQFLEALGSSSLNQNEKEEVIDNITAAVAPTYAEEDPIAVIKMILERIRLGDPSLLESSREVRRSEALKTAEKIRSHFDFNQMRQDLTAVNNNGLIPLDDEGEIYDRATKAGRAIENLDPDLSGLTPDERHVFISTAKAFIKTEEDLYSGHNQLLKKISYMERSGNSRNMAGPIDQFIRRERFKTGMKGSYGTIWWTSPSAISNITAHTSKSPLRKLYGPHADRQIFWPTHGSAETGVDLEKLRIAVNRFADNDGIMQDRSLEVFAKDPSGNWQPFFYVKTKNGNWIPSKTFMGKETRESCFSCHGGADGKFTPRPPKLLTSQEDLLSVGYSNRFVDSLMKY